MFLMLLLFVDSDNNLEKAKGPLIILFFSLLLDKVVKVIIVPALCGNAHISDVHECATLPPAFAVML